MWVLRIKPGSSSVLLTTEPTLQAPFHEFYEVLKRLYVVKQIEIQRMNLILHFLEGAVVFWGLYSTSWPRTLFVGQVGFKLVIFLTLSPTKSFFIHDNLQAVVRNNQANALYPISSREAPCNIVTATTKYIYFDTIHITPPRLTCRCVFSYMQSYYITFLKICMVCFPLCKIDVEYFLSIHKVFPANYANETILNLEIYYT